MDTVHLEGVLVTPGGTALSGQASVDLWDDGGWRTHFNLHSSSVFEPFDVDVRLYVTAPNFPNVLFFRHVGHVPAFGNDTPPDESGNIPLVATYWKALKGGAALRLSKEYSVGGVLGTVADVFDDIVKLFGGLVGTSIGVIIGVTKDAIGWMGATFGPGATLGLVGGVFVFAVSASLGIGVGAAALVGVVAAIVICVVTELVTDTRELEPGERDLARQVFGDTLDLDEIRLTSLGGASGRGFTARGIDGKIYLNLGRHFSNPLGSDQSYPYPGQLLIHELTHAWQIQHDSFLPGLMCSMLVTQAENTFVDDVYAYGPPGPSWNKLNPEQQAKIVDEWYAGSGLSDGWASMDQANIYYRYIWEDLLQHGSSPTAPATLRTSSSGLLTTNLRRSVQPASPTSPGSRPRVVEHVDVFWVAGDGSVVRHGRSDDTGELSSIDLPVPLSAPRVASADSPVAIVSPRPDWVDAFCIAPSGAAIVAAAWSGQVAPPIPPVGFAPITKSDPISPTPASRPGSPLVAISRTPKHIDVFWVGPSGSVTTAWWDQDQTGIWVDHDTFALPETAPAQTGSGLAVASRNAQHIDVFWVGEDGSIQTAWWDGAGPPGAWAEHPGFPITGPGAARLGSPVAAISRFPDQIDVFWVSPDGSVMTQWWRFGNATSWADHAPFVIATGAPAGPGSGLAVAARTQTHLDVFWIGPDNAVMTQWWDGSPGGNWPDHPPFAITAPGSAQSGSPLSAVSRNAGQIDVCFVAPDGAVMVQWWALGAHTSWADHGPRQAGPAGSLAHDYATAQHAAAHLGQDSAGFADVGEPEAAIDASRRAVDALVHAKVDPADAAQYSRQLFGLELDLAYRLLHGPPAQFVAASNDAIRVGLQAVVDGNDPVAVAASLRTLSSWASGAPAPQTALDAAVAGADILRPRLPAAGDEVRFYQTFALILFDVFDRAVVAGHPDLVAGPADETVQAYRQLAAAGGTITDISDYLMTLSYYASLVAPPVPAAVNAAQAAVDLLQTPAEPAEADLVRRGRLAQAEMVLAQRLIGAGRTAEARGPAEQSVEQYQALATDDPGYNGSLAQAEATLASLG